MKICAVMLRGPAGLETGDEYAWVGLDKGGERVNASEFVAGTEGADRDV